MNILFCDATPNWSGGANRIYLFSKTMKSRGHNIFVCCLPGSGLSGRLKPENINVTEYNPGSDINIFAVNKIKRIIIENKIDIIDIHSPKFYWTGSIAGKSCSKKVIITRNVPYRKSGLKKQVNKILYNRFADRVIAISDKIGRELAEDYKIPADRLNVIPDGIDISQFSSINKINCNYTNRKIIIGCISRLDNNKGLEYLIESIPKVLAKTGNVNFVIAGTGNIESSLKSRAMQLGLQSNITFTGFRTDIPDLLDKMDFTVLPSIQEGLSMAALESMSCSKPVVITSTCGLSDYITNKKNGIIVPPADSDSLASGIIDMINSDIAAMGKEARKLVETKFELNLVVNQYEKLLKTL